MKSEIWIWKVVFMVYPSKQWMTFVCSENKTHKKIGYFHPSHRMGNRMTFGILDRMGALNCSFVSCRNSESAEFVEKIHRDIIIMVLMALHVMNDIVSTSLWRHYYVSGMSYNQKYLASIQFHSKTPMSWSKGITVVTQARSS